MNPFAYKASPRVDGNNANNDANSYGASHTERLKRRALPEVDAKCGNTGHNPITGWKINITVWLAAQPGGFSFRGEWLAGENLTLYSALAGLHHFRLLHRKRKSSGVDVDKLINIIIMMVRRHRLNNNNQGVFALLKWTAAQNLSFRVAVDAAALVEQAFPWNAIKTYVRIISPLRCFAAACKLGRRGPNYCSRAIATSIH